MWRLRHAHLASLESARATCATRFRRTAGTFGLFSFYERGRRISGPSPAHRRFCSIAAAVDSIQWPYCRCRRPISEFAKVEHCRAWRRHLRGSSRPQLRCVYHIRTPNCNNQRLQTVFYLVSNVVVVHEKSEHTMASTRPAPQPQPPNVLLARKHPRHEPFANVSCQKKTTRPRTAWEEPLDAKVGTLATQRDTMHLLSRLFLLLNGQVENKYPASRNVRWMLPFVNVFFCRAAIRYSTVSTNHLPRAQQTQTPKVKHNGCVGRVGKFGQYLDMIKSCLRNQLCARSLVPSFVAMTLESAVIANARMSGQSCNSIARSSGKRSTYKPGGGLFPLLSMPHTCCCFSGLLLNASNNLRAVAASCRCSRKIMFSARPIAAILLISRRSIISTQ